MSLVSSASPVGGRGDASTDSGSENAASPPKSNSGNQYPCVTARLLTPAPPGGGGSLGLSRPGWGSAMVASSHTSKGRPSWLVMIPRMRRNGCYGSRFPTFPRGEAGSVRRPGAFRRAGAAARRTRLPPPAAPPRAAALRLAWAGAASRCTPGPAQHRATQRESGLGLAGESDLRAAFGGSLAPLLVDLAAGGQAACPARAICVQ